MEAEMEKGNGIDALYPAVIECFAVILLGFIIGKLGIVSSADTKGLNTFIGTLSLPSLCFISLAQLDLKAVNWQLILGVSLGKTTIFFCVLLICLLVSRHFDKAGLFAIFASQSNDFALGYPIILSLYGKKYADYLYLLGPVSLVFLNPIGFVFMEISRQLKLQASENSSQPNLINQKSKSLTIMKKVLGGLATNPVVVMTILGIIANLAFSHKLPSTIEGIFQILGSAFTASALFSLGLTMVGSTEYLKGAGFVVPGILIAVKLIVLPFVTREYVNLLNPGSSSNETIEMSNYGFLYGSLPTAPGVFVFATQYNVYVQMIASAMVACTFLSAPLMFLAAKMISLKDFDPSDYLPQLDKLLLNTSIIGLIAAVWVICVFTMTKKWRNIPHGITMALVMSQGVSCIGVLIWCYFGANLNGNTIGLSLQFSIFYIGVLSSRIWTAILAASLVFLKCRSLCFVLRIRPWLPLIGWGVPVFLTVILLLAVRRESLDEKQNPIFQYGESQALVTTMVLIICFIVTVGCLVLQQRYERKYSRILPGTSESTTSGAEPSVLSPTKEEDEENLLGHREDSGKDRTTRRALLKKCYSETDGKLPKKECSSINCGSCPRASSSAAGLHKSPEIEDLRYAYNETDESEIEEMDPFRPCVNGDLEICSARQYPSCSLEQRKYCRKLLEKYKALTALNESEEIGIAENTEDQYEFLQHLILLIILSISMFIGFILSFWTLIMEELSGIYVELIFLDAALNFGQSFFVWLIFGLERRTVLVPLQKWWRSLVYGEDSISKVTNWDQLSAGTKHICEQFLTYHADKCIEDIVRDRRGRTENHNGVFCGHELVDWLILVGLARDRKDAVRYGKNLVLGRVIRNVKGVQDFHDQAYFYTFLPVSTETERIPEIEN